MAGQKTRIRCIINPRSGAGRQVALGEELKRMADPLRFDVEIRLTEAPHHATSLAREAALAGTDLVIAVGGDGSVNEVAAGLEETGAALGIVPTGSGNGMARHLGLPMDPFKAFAVQLAGKTERIDTVRVNGRFCIGTFGIGFDAHIAHLFAAAPKRGYSTYVRLVLTEFRRYRPVRYAFTVDDKPFEKSCFLLTVANSSQFGNNAVIAPQADVQDGLLEISMMSAFPAWKAPGLIWRLMNNSLGGSRYFSSARGREVRIRNDRTLQAHIDGEPVTFDTDIHVKVVPASLTVVIP
jgi:diacylglycerol kinase (ATP)